MLDQLQMARNQEEQIALHHTDASTIADDDWFEVPCKSDGSTEAMRKCLESLAKLTCQNMDEYSAPILEFQFGEITTATSLLTSGKGEYLSITALLPRPIGDALKSTAHLSMSAAIEGDRNILWHADKGCYVIVRELPVSAFLDERSVLDAIADTADEAAAWQASISIVVSGK